MSNPKQALITGLVIFVGLATTAAAEDSGIEPAALLSKIGERCVAAKQYAFEGDLDVSRKSGERPMDVLAKGKVKLAIAPGGKYLLRVENIGKTAYLVVSDGQKSWAYVPALKRYTVREAAAVVINDEPNENFEDPQLYAKADIIDEFSRLVMPILTRLAETPASVFMKGSAVVKYDGQIRSWPVLTVLSKKDERRGQSLAYLTLDPTTLAIGRMTWTKAISSRDEKVFVRLNIDFDSFCIGEPIAGSEFTFSPPKDAKRVDSLRMPGQSGSFLLNKPAPDFELKSSDGHSVRMGALNGRSVLLNFGASWCGPCGRELAALAKIHEEYKDKGLSVLAISDEGQDTVGRYANEATLTFNSLNDSGGKVHRMYRVRSIPTVFLIDGKGKVVRFFGSVCDEQALRAALKSVGL